MTAGHLLLPQTPLSRSATATTTTREDGTRKAGLIKEEEEDGAASLCHLTEMLKPLFSSLSPVALVRRFLGRWRVRSIEG